MEYNNHNNKVGHNQEHKINNNVGQNHNRIPDENRIILAHQVHNQEHGQKHNQDPDPGPDPSPDPDHIDHYPDYPLIRANTVLKKKRNIPFWSKNPNVLFQQDYFYEFFPVESMSYNQKLNAVSRTVIVLTAIAFIFTRSIRLVAISAITLFAIFLLYYLKDDANKQVRFAETFEADDPAIVYLNKHGVPIRTDTFYPTTSHNPLGNVLVTDYEFDTNRKPAPPAYAANVNKSILENAKKMVSESNPDQPDIADKLFRDLGDEYVFEQSLRPFHSTASTTIPNDQGGFADFCYGDMLSCKQGNMFACVRDNVRYTNY